MDYQSNCSTRPRRGGVIPALAAAGHLLFPDFVTFLLRPNTFLDNHTLIAFTHCRGGGYPHHRSCGAFVFYLVRCW